MTTPLRGIVGGAHFLFRLFHHGDTPEAAKNSTRLVMGELEPLIGPATDMLDGMLSKPKPVMPDPVREPSVIVIDTYGEDVTVTEVSKPPKPKRRSQSALLLPHLKRKK